MYEPLLLYSTDGDFVGFAVRKTKNKFADTNIYLEGEEAEFRERLDDLNQGQAIRQNWPELDDPVVQGLLSNPDFEPLQVYDHEVVDDDKSDIVTYVEEDESEHIDHQRSTLVYKTIQVPNPSDVTARIHKACEIVARNRTGAKN